MTLKRSLTIIVIFIATSGILRFINQPELISPNRSFDTFPLKIGQWQGVPGKLDGQVYDILGLEDYILVNYMHPDRKLVNFYLGFYQSQKEGDLIHSPKNCMPGAGWRITRTGIETIDMDQQGGQIKVIRLLLEKGPEKQVVLYWFQSRGRIIASEYWQKIWLVVDSIFRHRTDGSFVRLISRVYTTEEDALATLRDFARQIYPYLVEYLPS